MTAPIALEEALDGTAIRQIFAAASRYLQESARAIDAINVYPVPDGDTGSNMSATLREAIERALALEGDPSVSAVLSAIARGALYGARGNSGVILSQALAGFAAGVGEREPLDGQSLAEGLVESAAHAYRAVSQPQEGTMLTVLREAGEAARVSALGLPGSESAAGCARVLGAAVAAGERAEAFTIQQLPALKEAGVTDAGGEGVCVILRGLLAAITGGVPEMRLRPAEHPLLHGESHGGDAFGFCTEFLIESDSGTLDLAAIKSLAEASGNRSVIVIGDPDVVRVHAHTLEPQALLASAEKFGELARVKVEDMAAQNVRFRAQGSGAGVKVAMLAMSRGDGFDDIFESLGAAVSDLGLVEKPPAGQIADAADALLVADVVVLANHKNVLLAAEQARALARCTIQVVPTRSLPQGVAAAMAFDPDETADVNLRAMTGAAESVRTVEVTIAGASRAAGGIAITKGDAIVLVDGVLVAKGANAREALLEGLQKVGLSPGKLVTIYAGEGVAEEEYRAIAARIREQTPGVEVEALSGGQPLYPFIASVE